MEVEKILVVDDNNELRARVREILEMEDFEVSEAADGPAGIKVFKDDPPDAVLLDLNMPGMGGMEVLQEFRQIDPNVPVVIHTGFGDIPTTVEAMRVGAYDFIEKGSGFERLVNILRTAVETRRKAGPDLLSHREIEVLGLLKHGKNSRDMAELLSITERTVKFHIQSIMQKLNATNRTQAVARAIELNLIEKD